MVFPSYHNFFVYSMISPIPHGKKGKRGQSTPHGGVLLWRRAYLLKFINPWISTEKSPTKRQNVYLIDIHPNLL